MGCSGQKKTRKKTKKNYVEIKPWLQTTKKILVAKAMRIDDMSSFGMVKTKTIKN